MHVTYEVRWQNFRAFRDTNWLKIKPLTILIGANNAGKSSFALPFLMLNQTLNSPDYNSALITRGALVDAGNFSNISHNHQPDKPVKFGFRFHTHEPETADNLEPVGTYPPGVIEVELDRSGNSMYPRLKRLQIQDIYCRPFLTRKVQRNGNYSIDFPIDSRLDKKELNSIINTKPTNFLFTPSMTIHSYEQLTKSDRLAENEDYSSAFSRYLAVVGTSFEELRRIFYALAYIGPLRERPKRYYEDRGEIPKSVGARGQRTALLLRHRLASMKNEINTWVKRFEFGEELVVNQVSEDIFSIEFMNYGKMHNTNIADAGFGASQIIPLIVQASAASEGSITIAEQPEIHLNPKLQAVLGDLFVKMAKTDHRVIVETHSEHLLMRVRYLIATGDIAPNDVALYYVEKERNYSAIREIALDSDGQIDLDEWPVGFFEDSLRQTLAIAAVRSNKRV